MEGFRRRGEVGCRPRAGYVRLAARPRAARPPFARIPVGVRRQVARSRRVAREPDHRPPRPDGARIVVEKEPDHRLRIHRDRELAAPLRRQGVLRQGHAVIDPENGYHRRRHGEHAEPVQPGGIIRCTQCRRILRRKVRVRVNTHGRFRIGRSGSTKLPRGRSPTYWPRLPTSAPRSRRRASSRSRSLSCIA